MEVIYHRLETQTELICRLCLWDLFSLSKVLHLILSRAASPEQIPILPADTPFHVLVGHCQEEHMEYYDLLMGLEADQLQTIKSRLVGLLSWIWCLYEKKRGLCQARQLQVCNSQVGQKRHLVVQILGNTKIALLNLTVYQIICGTFYKLLWVVSRKLLSPQYLVSHHIPTIRFKKVHGNFPLSREMWRFVRGMDQKGWFIYAPIPPLSRLDLGSVRVQVSV